MLYKVYNYSFGVLSLLLLFICNTHADNILTTNNSTDTIIIENKYRQPSFWLLPKIGIKNQDNKENNIFASMDMLFAFNSNASFGLGISYFAINLLNANEQQQIQFAIPENLINHAIPIYLTARYDIFANDYLKFSPFIKFGAFYNFNDYTYENMYVTDNYDRVKETTHIDASIYFAVGADYYIYDNWIISVEYSMFPIQVENSIIGYENIYNTPIPIQKNNNFSYNTQSYIGISIGYKLY